jgi:hypothetical protein
MIVLIKLFYAASIAALLILFVAFGIRTFDAPPEEPQFPNVPPSFRPASPIPAGQTPPEPTQEQREFEEAQRRYQEEFKAYEDERADYRRNVFLVAAATGVLAIAGGLALSSRLDALRLGLVAGGLGAILYAVIQSGGDLGDAGPALVFGVVAIGLLLVGYAGYRWLAAQASEQ